MLRLDGASDSKEVEIKQKPLEWMPEEPRVYKKKYEMEQELGHGIWSNVYRATEKSENLMPSVMLPPSPPVSPESNSQSSRAQILAIKVPSRRDAQKILKKEARVLTYLHSQNNATSYLVPFHGFNTVAHAIVMDAIPTSLEAQLKSTVRGGLTTNAMFDPVIGAQTWASLAEQLINGLAFLHFKGCVHGDIKPANILLRTDKTTGTLVPLYCDFSSARILFPNTPASETEEISAVTADFTSPELLASFYHRNGDRAMATSASDVFALAVTLLYAATGESPYADARMEMMKLYMAKEGAPIEFARRGNQASRVMEGRAVAKVLDPAVLKDAEKRIGVEDWKVVAKGVIEGWKKGGWAKGG